MRQLYSTLFAIAIPCVLLRLFWRGLKAPAYRLRWRERLGRYQQASEQNVIWFHAVSVGEVEAAIPLVNYLSKQHPDRKILITTTTPTGSARVLKVFADSVEHVYMPYDTPTIVERFLEHFQPVMAIIMETEIWPNLFQRCQQNHIPVVIVNARLSKKSVSRYQLLSSFIRETLATVYMIAAQTDTDRLRYLSLGADPARVQITGNIKFDLEIPKPLLEQSRQLRQKLFHGRLVWIIASTHKGEEEIFLALYKQFKERYPNLLLVLVPRHPERFPEVKSLCSRERLRTVLRSSNMPCHEAVDVYIGDTMGELKLLYAAADISFVGGSMVPVGGHNVLEPAAVNVPVLFGPHMENFADIAQGFLAQDAAIQCQDQAAVAKAFVDVIENPDRRRQLVANASEFVSKNQGALIRVGTLLTRILTIKDNHPVRPLK